MTPVTDALRAILAAVRPLPVERVALLDALGRVLAEPRRTREDVPAFDNSAMDGFAVRAADLGGQPGVLPVSGVSRAGGGAAPALPAGAAIRIFTGAPMPAGADAVVIQEDTEPEGERVRVLQPPTAGENVRPRGEVLRAGGELLPAGATIGPGEIAVLAGQGYASLPVHRAARVAILSTGDELREIGAPARPGSLIDSNRYALAAAVRAAGAIPVMLGPGPDDPAALAARLAEGLDGADLVLSTGGASVGEHDHLAEAFRRAGVESTFWKVRMKPGKPVRFGARDGRLVLGLPGNPVSALVTFELLVRPVLRRLAGDPRPFRRRRRVVLATPARAPATRAEFARARWTADGRAALFPKQGSSVITSMVANDLLVLLPMGAGTLEAGEEVDALDVGTDGGSATWPIPDDV